jgi:hypothetical protein
MRKALTLLLAVFVFSGCASLGRNQKRYDPSKDWAKKEIIKEAIREVHRESTRKAEQALLAKIKAKTKARVEMSSIEVVSADWNGILFHKLGDIKLRFAMKESNGVGVEFDKYYVRVICVYSGLFGTDEVTRTGTFFFRNPLKLEALELKDVFLNMNTWISRTANSMDRSLNIEEYRVYVTLTGKDNYGNTIVADSESAPI